MEYSTSSVISLISHIHTLSQDFTNSRLEGYLNGDGKLVSSHGYILYQLSINQKLTMGELSKLINRDKSTTTALIKKLMEQGLVQTETSPEDSRVKYIHLTEKGSGFNKATSSISKDLLETCWKGFSQEEKDTLLKLLLKLNGNIEKK